MQIDFKQLALAMGDLKEKEILDTVRAIASEAPDLAQDTVDALSSGMDIIGERFDYFEYFVGDLIFAGEIFSEALTYLLPLLGPTESDGKKREKVILATVEGDFHDIGKNIVAVVLRSKGFNVVDLGVNVPPSVIVAKTIEENAKLVALSAVLTSAIDAMQQTVAALQKAGIRERVSVVVGGACVNETIAKKIKADFYGHTPEDTAAFCVRASQ